MNNLILKLAMRQVRSPKTMNCGKYYARIGNAQTLSQRGFIEHMIAHGLSYPRFVIEGVLSQIVKCLPEMLGQGVGVKFDSLGTFYPTIENATSGVAYADLKAGGINPNDIVSGVHVRFLPDDSKLDALTSRQFKEKCTLELATVQSPQQVTRGTGDDAKTETVWQDTLYAAWQLLPASADGHV